MPKTSLFLLMLLAGAAPLTSTAHSEPAAAPAVEKIREFGNLTDENVRSFYDQSKQVHTKSYHDYAAFMSAHTTETATITLNMTNHLPGGKEQKQTLIMDKDKFVASLPENYRFSQGAKVEHKITNIDIAPDAKTAIIKDVTFISNSIMAPTARGEVKLDVQTQSSCEDQVVDTPGEVIKIQKSTCTSESFFFFPKPAISSPKPPPSDE